MKCDICGELHSLDEGKIIKGSGHTYFVCDDCEPEDYVICDDCGELVEEDRTYTTHDNRIICENCYESNDYFTCDKCGKVVEDCHIVHIQDTEEYVCDDCADEHYYQCMECAKWYSGNRIITDNNNQHLCEDCYRDNYYTCAECGEFVHQNDCYWNVFQDEAYCEYCYNTNETQSRVINSYHSNDDWTIHYTEDEYNNYVSDKLTLGLEIEVAGYTDFAEGFMERVDNDLIYLERDGSVDGFEIITQPMTRKYATELFNDKISKGFEFLKEHNFKGHNAGGIHIHVRLPYDNPDFMSCLLKLKKLLYNLSPSMQDLLLLISQRSSDKLKQWSDNTYNKLTLQECMLQHTRYELLNTDSRTKTLEFRMFNSNLRTERIMKNVEVVLSLLDYVDTYYTVNMYDKNLFTWLDYVKRNEEKYPNLVRFINEDKIKDKLCEIGYIKEGVESLCV